MYPSFSIEFKTDEVLYNPLVIIELLTSFAADARTMGLLSLEERLDQVEDHIFTLGIQLVVDGTEPLLIYEILKRHIHSKLDALKSRGEMIIAGGWITIYSQAGVRLVRGQQPANGKEHRG